MSSIIHEQLIRYEGAVGGLKSSNERPGVLVYET
jgi:hypothetical protein